MTKGLTCDATELGGSTAKAFFPLRSACQALWFTGKRPTRFCAGAVTSRDGDSWDGDWGDASGSGSVFQLSEPIRYRAYKWGFRVDNSESLHPFTMVLFKFLTVNSVNKKKSHRMF